MVSTAFRVCLGFRIWQYLSADKVLNLNASRFHSLSRKRHGGVALLLKSTCVCRVPSPPNETPVFAEINPQRCNRRGKTGLRLFCSMSGEPVRKKLAQSDNMRIGTHNGTFHCDEVLACYMLKILPEYKDADIVRSRDEEILGQCNIVVDVGGVYNPAKHRYDHHQRDFKDNMNSLDSKYPWVTKLSSAGLVYFHFGHKIIAKILGKTPGSDLVEAVYKKVYENFMEEIDAIDNGISVSDERPRYLVTTNLSSRVSHLNPTWNEDSYVDIDARFHKALELVGVEFQDRVKYFAESWWPAREIVKNAMEKRMDVDSSGEIIEFKQGGCPWKDHVFALEEELNLGPKIKFVLFSDQSGNWRVQCVSVRSGSFVNRISLLEEWRGLRDDKLSEVSGIPDCIFVHASGFIGGNKTRKGVLQLARQTLQKTIL